MEQRDLGVQVHSRIKKNDINFLQSKVFLLSSPRDKVMSCLVLFCPVLSCQVLCFLCVVVEGLVETGPRRECSFLDPRLKLCGL